MPKRQRLALNPLVSSSGVGLGGAGACVVRRRSRSLRGESACWWWVCGGAWAGEVRRVVVGVLTPDLLVGDPLLAQPLNAELVRFGGIEVRAELLLVGDRAHQFGQAAQVLGDRGIAGIG